MPHDTHSRIVQSFILISMIILVLIPASTYADLSSLARNDAYPVFTTLNLDDSWLLTKKQLEYKEKGWAEKKHDRVNISVSPYGQNADRGKTIRDELFPLSLFPTTPATPVINPFDPGTGPQTYNTLPMIVPLGDLNGRMGMIALMFGGGPKEKTISAPVDPTVRNIPLGKEPIPALQEAYNELFMSSGAGVLIPNEKQQLYIDPQQQFGYFSNILQYRVQGVRFELTGRVWKGFGIKIQTGVSTIRQVLEARVNMTVDESKQPSNADPTTKIDAVQVNQFLMDPINAIAQQIGINIGSFLQTSIGELRFNFFWRDAFDLNKGMEAEWARFLLIPYVQISGSVSPGKKENPKYLWAVPFGNDGHSSFGFTTGLNFDFIETIEVGGEVGFTTFFKKSFSDYFVPNNQFQTTLFPYSTAVTIQPGHNWYLLVRLAAYHFLDNLSMHFEWMMLNHNRDEITLKNPDPVFLPQLLERRSSFKTKIGTVGFNYDVSPNITLGFLWQMPFSQRNAYRTSTIMGGINVTF